MMNAFFRELFQYNHHCNRQLINALAHQEVSPKSILLMSHVLCAHQIWNNRILSLQAVFGVWQLHDVADMTQINDENYQHSLKILADSSVEEVITYRTSKGDEFSNSVRDLLFHVINHSTYHRAQIATDFKQHGVNPIATDYIFYKR